VSGSDPPTPPDGSAARGSSPARNPEARLARIHLRTGLHALARAELETLAGQGALDADALVDLAEVRWRTGDMVGAGDAARACVEAGVDASIVLVVAAEAAAASGRAGEARELVSQVVAREPYSIDTLFAGVPRSPFWPGPPLPAPVTSMAPGSPVPTHMAVGTPYAATRYAATPYEATAVDRGQTGGPAAPLADAVAGSGPGQGQSAWPERSAFGEVPTTRLPLPDELADIQASVARHDTAGIGVRMSIVLRAQPTLAPAVLAVAEDALRTSPAAPDAAALHLVRSDAYRLMGRETLSRQAVQQAHGALRVPRDQQE
jgi:hypothetical protein